MMLLSSGPAGHILFLTVLVLVDRAGGWMECWDPPKVPTDDAEYDPLENHEDKSKLPPLAGRTNCSLNNKAKEYDDIGGGGTVELDCGKDVIYSVNVTAWVNESRKCGGLTPELLTSSKNCFWKNSCDVIYEPSIIMFPFSECFGEEPSFLELSYTCLKSDTTIRDVKNTHQVIESESGMLVASMSLEGETGNRRYQALIRPPPSMTCVQGVEIQVKQAEIKNGSRVYITHSNRTNCVIQDEECPVKRLDTDSFVFNVYNTNFIPSYHVTFQWYRKGKKRKNKMPKGGKCKNSENVEKGNIFPIIKETTSKSSKGILRSHDRFPWNYRRPLGTRHQSQWTSFYHRLEAPTAGQDLLIKVVNFDLDPRDTLQFRVDGVIRKISKTDVGKLKTYDKCKKLEVNFTVQHGGFLTRSGFLILYEWIINSKPEMFLKIPVFYDQKCNRSDVDISSKKSRKPEIKKDKCGVKKAKNRTDEKTTDIIIGQKNKTQKKRSRKKRRLETIKKSS